MTRSELITNLRSMSAGTIAIAICNTNYAVIDRSISSAIIYASEKATEDEIKPIEDLSDIIRFLQLHCTYNPSWCGLQHE